MGLSKKLHLAAWCLKNPKSIYRALRKSLPEEKRLAEESDIIRSSEYYDNEWYLRNSVMLPGTSFDGARHYLDVGAYQGKDPSLSFCSEEYLALHADVAAAKMNPLLHYELHGKDENRELSFLELKDPVFPDGAVDAKRCFAIAPVKHKRVAVLSCFTSSGHLPDTLFYLIHGIHEVADQVILVGDCPIIPSELDRLDGLVVYAQFERHQQYDFGSYKRGLSFARKSGLLAPAYADELVFLNDSCYGPVYPFSESFNQMSRRPNDFWGYNYYSPNFQPHVSSYFMVFKRNIIDSMLLDQFLDRVQGVYDRGMVIATLETQLTGFLESHGMYSEAYAQNSRLGLFNHPLTFLKQYRVPLIKKKAFSRKSKEDMDEVFRIIEKNAPDLAAMIPHQGYQPKAYRMPTIEEHQQSFAEKCCMISEKVKNGLKIRALFLVPKASMFPSRPLFDAMLSDPLFDPFITVIPDVRWERNPLGDIVTGEKELIKDGVPATRLIPVRQDVLGRWPDVCQDMDLVCYNTPYDLSSFRYRPRYSVGRNFLPIMVNYGFYRSKYDDHILALDSYAYLWKAFFECGDTVTQYQENSHYGGKNAEITGYIKMDSLADVPCEPHTRKRILVALHHSIDGGTNKYLNLANIVRYEEYFLSLPDHYPDLDFVYRPHPFLLRVLSEDRFWGPVKVEQYFSSLKAKPNVIWSDGGDYFKEFAESDGCIQDCGSYLVEYLYAGKPCCYMLKSPSDIPKKFAPLGQKCLEQCYISYDTASIDHFINHVIIQGQDDKAASRSDFAKSIMVNYPHAAETALQSIKAGICQV